MASLSFVLGCVCFESGLLSPVDIIDVSEDLLLLSFRAVIFSTLSFELSFGKTIVAIGGVVVTWVVFSVVVSSLLSPMLTCRSLGCAQGVLGMFLSSGVVASGPWSSLLMWTECVFVSSLFVLISTIWVGAWSLCMMTGFGCTYDFRCDPTVLVISVSSAGVVRVVL